MSVDKLTELMELLSRANTLTAELLREREHGGGARTDAPGTWHDSVPAKRRYFTHHASERAQERYGIAFAQVPKLCLFLLTQVTERQEAVHLYDVDGQYKAWAGHMYARLFIFGTDFEQTIITTFLPADVLDNERIQSSPRTLERVEAMMAKALASKREYDRRRFDEGP